MRWRDWIIVGVSVGIAVVGWVLFRQSPSEALASKKHELLAAADARRLEADVGLDKALKEIETKYAKELVDMETANAKKVEKLRRNPSALARALARASRARVWDGGRSKEG